MGKVREAIVYELPRQRGQRRIWSGGEGYVLRVSHEGICKVVAGWLGKKRIIIFQSPQEQQRHTHCDCGSGPDMLMYACPGVA